MMVSAVNISAEKKVLSCTSSGSAHWPCFLHRGLQMCFWLVQWYHPKECSIGKKLRIFTKHPVKMYKIDSSTILLFLFLSETIVLDDGIVSLLFLF